MFRIVAGRSTPALLVAVLIALPFFAPAHSFASAHTARQVEAKAPTGITLSGTAQLGETVTHRHCDAVLPAPGTSRSSTARTPAALQVFRR
ncbi:hypothetical protein ACIRPX_21965 [Streptomyces sp. NPDC101225]|uniref:hypothetical protein n=1 Tax=Streptomyces sp. NPDC101225 TaxID=3366135 RepID=UPI00380CB169